MAGEQGLSFLVMDVARLFRQRIEGALDDGGLRLTAGEARTLTVVERHPRARQARLAALMGLEPMTLGSFLHGLEKRGLVRRVEDPDDRRAKLIEITDAAEPVLRQIATICDGLRRSATDGLGDGEIDAMQAGLLHARERLAESDR
jgi:DNA-binding MarR family transcriptional regulator